MTNVDAVRVQLLQAVIDVVDRLDDRGIPIRIPDPPLSMDRVPIEDNEAASAEGDK